MIRVGYMGAPFSNSAEMSRRLSESLGLGECEHVALKSSRGVVDALMAGTVDYGVLAVSNRFAGTVMETQDALAGHPIEILRLEWMPIHHCVFVKDGDVGVTKLISHVQALMQSERTLRSCIPMRNSSSVRTLRTQRRCCPTVPSDPNMRPYAGRMPVSITV